MTCIVHSWWDIWVKVESKRVFEESAPLAIYGERQTYHREGLTRMALNQSSRKT